MAQFFIHRPVFAWVIALFIMLAGGLSIFKLPIAQYPSIAPPAISITAVYPGASAQTLENSVAQIIEQKMKGIDNLIYISSSSESTGQTTVTLTFAAGTDPNIAQIQVQNKLQLATPLLPEAVQRQGLQVAKSVRNFLMVIGFVSRDRSMDVIDLGDYVSDHVIDPISRLEGVGDVTLFGSQYAMRIWLDPNKLREFGLTTAEIKAAIQAENAEVTAGQLGGRPAVVGQPINVSITVQNRLKTPEQFGNILIKSDNAGAKIRLRDVARIEIDADSYTRVARYKGDPAVGMAIKLAPGANALDTAEIISSKLKELGKYYPPGMESLIGFDSTPFIRISIEEVLKTLTEAIILVFVVMYLFLQNFRATLIPTVAVPVVLLGTFGVLSLFGYSINTLTLFATVLAIGLLVDDAIVVVENVERVMHEEGLAPKEATIKSMKQITGALIGIAVVLSAVFIPMAFFPGSAGVIYRQFSVTIISAMLLSVGVAIILTPALCATLLKPVLAEEKTRGFPGWFNRQFKRLTRGYTWGVNVVLGYRIFFSLLYLLLIVGVGKIYLTTPTGFLPSEDQGMLMTLTMMPSGATMEQTMKVVEKIEQHYLKAEAEAVEGMFSVLGFNFAGSGQNAAMAFVRLKNWDLRQRPDLKVDAITQRAMGVFSKIREARVVAFSPPAVFELGNTKGFDLYLQDSAGLGREKLLEARNQLLGMAAAHPQLFGVRPNGMEPAPILNIRVDRDKASVLGISLNHINETLSTAWGSSYVDDFLNQGRVKKVYLQGDAQYRMVPDHLRLWTVRNGSGDMVPFSSFATTEWGLALPKLERYNGLPSVEILGEPSPGHTTGQAMIALEQLKEKLPAGISMEWTGISYEERASGKQAMALYVLSILAVFLCLAALYESWTIPLAVILIVPLGVLGTLLAATLRHMPSDIYFQVALLTIVGLSAKNAILIVEFAKTAVEQGKSVIQATIEAAQTRLRPILMTSLAFGFGVLPLAISSGAGSGSQNAIGTGVLGGMIGATLLGIFFVPLFFILIRPGQSKDYYVERTH